MDKDWLAILSIVLGLFFPSYGSQGIQQLSPFKVVANRVEMASSTAGFRVPSLANLGCLGTDADGDFGSGSCSGGSGSSAFEIATTSSIAVPQVAYFTKTAGRTTLGSVATGTVSESGLIGVTAGQSVIGSGLTISLDNINANTVIGNRTGASAAPAAFATSSLFA